MLHGEEGAQVTQQAASIFSVGPAHAQECREPYGQ